ncbi:uncharacterized protein [Temnothorax longispinosus]|uniref:uncharacterized protein n=1 Tax=Temnothorax longispinosus TaxID=300112 RepID=UPI003A9A38C3
MRQLNRPARQHLTAPQFTQSLVRQLNITRNHSVILITGIGGGKATQTRGVALLKLRSLHSRSDVIIQAHVLQALANILPSFNAAPQEWPHLTKLTLADPDFLTPQPVDIIIGADSYGQIIKPTIIKQDPLMPIAQLSIFGWLVFGPVDISSPASAAVHHASIQEREDALDELLSKFWTQEEVPASTNHDLTPDEKRCEEYFKVHCFAGFNRAIHGKSTCMKMIGNIQRILWIDDQLNEVPHYLTTVTYGTKAAPFLSVRRLLQLVEDEGHSFILAVLPIIC